MKRVFWSLFGAMVGAFLVWFFARRRMDTLYGELSRFHLIERKREESNAYFAKKNEEDRIRKEIELAAMTAEQRIDYEMRQAQVNSHMKSLLGEDVYNELKD